MNSDKETRNKYSKCNHIWIVNNNVFNIKKCLKCSLTDEVFRKNDLSKEELIMKKYISDIPNSLIKGTTVGISCDYYLAYAIYERILRNNPKIDDELIRKYIEISLKNISKKVNKENKINNLVKRLSNSNNS